MKTLRIITSSSPGLLNDAETYKKIFVKYKLNVDININERYWTHKYKKKKYDINLFLEHISPENYTEIFPCDINIFMPNQELFISFIELQNIKFILCKTKISLQYFEYIKKEKNYEYTCIYTKFTTNIPKNLKNITINKNPNLFVHLAGKSGAKNTASLIYCWIKNNGFIDLDPNIQLYITCYRTCFKKMISGLKELYNFEFNFNPNQKEFKIKNIIFYSEPAPPEKYNELLINANVALCISSQEGYGHYINEARFFETCVIVLDHSPMNELVENNFNGYIINDPILQEKEWLNDFTSFKTYKAFPKIDILTDVIIKCIKNKNNLHDLGKNGKNMYKKDKKYFKKKMKKFINENLL